MNVLPNGANESRGNCFWAGDGRTDDHREGSCVKGAADFFRLGNVAFEDERDPQFMDQRGYHIPVDRAGACGLRGKAIQRGGDGVSPDSFGYERFFGSGDVGEGGLLQFRVYTGDEFGPRFGFWVARGGAVERDDVGSGTGDGLGRFEVRSDGDASIDYAFLDAEDGQSRLSAKGSGGFRTVRSQPSSSSAQNRYSDAPKHIYIVERIARRGLDGDDEFFAERGWEGRMGHSRQNPPFTKGATANSNWVLNFEKCRDAKCREAIGKG